MTDKSTNHADLVEQLDRAEAELKERHAALLRSRGEVEQRIGKILDEPVALKEVGDIVRGMIDRRAWAFRSAGGGWNAAAVPGAKTTLRLIEAGNGPDLEMLRGLCGMDKPVSMDWFCFFFGDMLKERLGQLYPSDAPARVATIDARRQEVARLQEQIREIDAQLMATFDALIRLGRPLFPGARSAP